MITKKYQTSLLQKVVMISIFLVITLFFVPYSFELILSINFLFILFTGVSRVLLFPKKKKVVRVKEKTEKPFVSIHIPICSEPPAVVASAVRAAFNQNYDNFEIIIISNNTKDESLWKPIEFLAGSLGDKVTFINVKRLSGYKAGALNLARKLTSKQATYIFTLDADYILHQNALSDAVATITSRKLAVLQYPQSYSNTSLSTTGISDNYELYFDCFSEGANYEDVALPTGTLTLIHIKVLDAIKGWSASSITEDAMLGLSVLEKGYKTGFKNKVIGQGLIPGTFEDFRKQRARWIFGNLQVLLTLLQNRTITLKKKWFLSLQLTAWINFLGIPLLCVVYSTLLKLANPEINIYSILGLAGFSVFTHLVLYMGIALQKVSNHPLRALSMLCAHLSTIEYGAFYWWNIFFQKEKPFNRTNKFYKNGTFTIQDFITPLILLLTGLLLFISYPVAWYGAIVAVFGTLIFLAKLVTIYELGETRKAVKTSTSI
ncbi:glycosyltransferase [Aquimarina sp. ERC-38]|uniref:glycosyltransferase family 2 protein n=1 Tax=Aquimarina sp. ERC-38 TaxID=2949996 RepID=UPI002246564B|nr:glycosyltransferase family 2 protein [Aquimarina sp. ERC-38]UZO82406.1 glycosyltransferase [Aquimarina sp. ERC-38]